MHARVQQTGAMMSLLVRYFNLPVEAWYLPPLLGQYFTILKQIDFKWNRPSILTTHIIRTCPVWSLLCYHFTHECISIHMCNNEEIFKDWSTQKITNILIVPWSFLNPKWGNSFSKLNLVVFLVCVYYERPTFLNKLDLINNRIWYLSFPFNFCNKPMICN